MAALTFLLLCWRLVDRKNFKSCNFLHWIAFSKIACSC